MAEEVQSDLAFPLKILTPEPTEPIRLTAVPPDPASDLARLLGVERLAATARSRLDEAIARARQHLQN